VSLPGRVHSGRSFLPSWAANFQDVALFPCYALLHKHRAMRSTLHVLREMVFLEKWRSSDFGGD